MALDQHATDREDGVLFMRLEFQTPHLDVPRSLLEQAFANEVAAKFDMHWRLSYATDAPRMAIFVSKHDHVLMDLLWRLDRGDLSASFVDRYANRIINIHHSFLPAFAGADPYRQACDRGVKLIGATAHYVTAELDTGAIIDQDVVRVNHRQSPGDLRRLGRDVERSVLARAVRWHLEDRLIVHENKTVVFV